MTFGKSMRRDLSALFLGKFGTAFERLARLQAYKMNGNEYEVVGIVPCEGGCFIRLLDPNPYVHQAALWVGYPVELKGGKIRVRYQAKPEERLLMMYGRHKFRMEPTAYLALTES